VAIEVHGLAASLSSDPGFERLNLQN
jgi:hypothetical protein